MVGSIERTDAACRQRIDRSIDARRAAASEGACRPMVASDGRVRLGTRGQRAQGVRIDARGRPSARAVLRSLHLEDLALACACAQGSMPRGSTSSASTGRVSIGLRMPSIHRGRRAILPTRSTENCSGWTCAMASAVPTSATSTAAAACRRGCVPCCRSGTSIVYAACGVRIRCRRMKRRARFPRRREDVDPRRAGYVSIMRRRCHGRRGQARAAGSSATALLLCAGSDTGADWPHAQRVRGHRVTAPEPGTPRRARRRRTRPPRAAHERRRNCRLFRRPSSRILRTWTWPSCWGLTRGQTRGQTPRARMGRSNVPRVRRGLVQGNGKGTPETTAACIDAETLAAWADGGLSKSDAAAVETHLADCERCTAMLATFARTIPETPVAESLWTRWHLRWLVPAATAATVAALWVLVPRPDSPQMTIGPAPTDRIASAGVGRQCGACAAARSAGREERARGGRPRRRRTNPADTFAKREANRPHAPQQPTDERRADARRRRQAPAAAPLNETFAVRLRLLRVRPIAPKKESPMRERNGSHRRCRTPHPRAAAPAPRACTCRRARRHRLPDSAPLPPRAQERDRPLAIAISR